jgi:NADH-quinone oxidoreductase B subunit
MRKAQKQFVVSRFTLKGKQTMALNITETWEHTLDAIRTWARINSPWAIHYNSGSCNGCDIEILATLTPRYDLERFGVKLQGSPRHADVLICTGPVTLQSRDRLKRIYEQMPEPKFVVAVGTCATSGGVFQGCYNVVGHIDEVIPVNAYIPGCPPRPEAIIDGVVKLLQSLQPAKAPTPAPRPKVADSAPVEESAA